MHSCKKSKPTNRRERTACGHGQGTQVFGDDSDRGTGLHRRCTVGLPHLQLQFRRVVQLFDEQQRHKQYHIYDKVRTHIITRARARDECVLYVGFVCPRRQTRAVRERFTQLGFDCGQTFNWDSPVHHCQLPCSCVYNPHSTVNSRQYSVWHCTLA